MLEQRVTSASWDFETIHMLMLPETEFALFCHIILLAPPEFLYITTTKGNSVGIEWFKYIQYCAKVLDHH